MIKKKEIHPRVTALLLKILKDADYEELAMARRNNSFESTQRMLAALTNVLQEAFEEGMDEGYHG